jgi:hypothetical protein
VTVARAREELLDAAQSNTNSRENRLTEVFATVLEYHDGLARALFKGARVDLPDGNLRFEVFTQRAVAPGARVDMVLLAYRGPRLGAQLWFEHKVGGGAFRDLQLEDYRDALAAERAPGRLVGIVAEIESDTSTGADWSLLTWQEVAELANHIGREWGKSNGVDRDWRTSALEPTAPARERLLHELIWYLEEENGAVVNPLDADNLQAFVHAEETTQGFITMLERAGEHMRPHFEPDQDGLDGDPGGGRYWQLFEVPEGSWLRRIADAQFEAYPELMASPDDRWWAESRGEPAFAAGYTLDGRLYERLAADGGGVHRVQEAGVDLAIYDDLVRLFCTKPVKELLNEGQTLDEQAHVLAQFAKRSLTIAADLDPGEFEFPSKRKRRARLPDGDDAGTAHVTQPIYERDIRQGIIRIPRATKELFPAEPSDLDVELRGQRMTCRYNPRFGSRGKQEHSGSLGVGREVLAELVKPDERLHVERFDGSYRLS